MLALHDAILVDRVVWATVLVGLLALALVVWRRPSSRRIVLALLAGAVLCPP